MSIIAHCIVVILFVAPPIRSLEIQFTHLLSPRDGFPLILTYKPRVKVYQGSLPRADDPVLGMDAD